MSKPFEGEDMAATMERVARDDFYETRRLPTVGTGRMASEVTA